MRRIVRVLGISLVFLVIMALPVYAANKGTLIGSNVNVRNEAALDAGIVGKVSQGDTVTVLGNHDTWFQVQLTDGTKGYISKEFVQLSASLAAVCGEGVNVRDTNSTSGAVIGQLSQGETVTATGKNAEWIQIAYNGKDAYVHVDFVQGENLVHLADFSSADKAVATKDITFATITSSTGLKLREEASTESLELAIFPYSSSFEVLSEDELWVKVSTNQGDGYFHKDFVTLHEGAAHALFSSKGQEIVDYAKQFVGTPYRWSGTNLKSGVDCSGFVYAVFRDFGITLNRSSRDMASNGSKVEKSQLLPGDLVFFHTGSSSSINHVGIYIGNGNFIHSSSGSAYSVVISSLNEGYYVNRYVTGRRIV